MPTIIPKGYYCPKCKKEIKKKVCECGANAKPIPPYTVRFRWINENGIEEHKRLTGTPPWTTQSSAQKGYEQWVADHPRNRRALQTDTSDFSALLEKYKKHLFNQVKESSYLVTVDRLDRFAVPTFGNKKVSDISKRDIRDWQDELAQKGFALGYLNAIRAALTGFFTFCEEEGFPSPMKGSRGFSARKYAKPEIDFWTQSEFEQFIHIVKEPKYFTFFSFLYLTGCRRGEACALRWNEVDLSHKTVKIISTATKKTINGQSTYAITTPKTERSFRTVLLPDELVAALNNWKELSNPSSENNFVFGSADAPMPFTTLGHAFDRYTKASGVKRIRVHDLRHSHVSLLINQGSGHLSMLYVIAARIGDTPEMVLETYGHLFPDRQADVIANLSVNLGTELGTRF